MNRFLAIASAAEMILTMITGVAQAQAPQQPAPSVQQVSRAQADKIMQLNYKEFAALPSSARMDRDEGQNRSSID
jgi:hypothetical protein